MKKLEKDNEWINNNYSIPLGHSLIMALNKTIFETNAKIIIRIMTNKFPWIWHSTPLNAIKNEMRLFKKWAKIGTRIFLDLI